MSTNQRLLLATALSFLFFLFYSTVVPQPQPQNQNIEKTNQVQAEQKKIEPTTAPQVENEKNSAPTVPVTNVKQVQKQIVENKDLLVKITFNNAILTIDTLGRISSKTLLEDKFIMTNPNDITIVNVINNLLENDGYLKEIKGINYKKSLDFTIEKNAEETIEIINKAIQYE